MKKVAAVLASLMMVMLVVTPIPAFSAGIGAYSSVLIDEHKRPRPHNHGRANPPDPNPHASKNPHVKPAPRITPRRNTTPNRPRVSSGGSSQGTTSPRSNRPPRPARQQPILCVIIEQPIETKVIYKTQTRTKTERVLYGVGLVSLVATGVGLLTLFLGYLLGWRSGGREARNDEKKFHQEILHPDE